MTSEGRSGGPANNVIPSWVELTPEVRQPPRLPRCYAMKPMLAATAAAHLTQVAAHMQLGRVCIAMQMFANASALCLR